MSEAGFVALMLLLVTIAYGVLILILAHEVAALKQRMVNGAIRAARQPESKQPASQRETEE